MESGKCLMHGDEPMGHALQRFCAFGNYCLSAFSSGSILFHEWLAGKYTYRTELSWWVFVASGIGALVITLLTVSFQAIKAALLDPVKSLKTE
ncbi:MAG: hypothetical protein U0V04_20375 [Spirosomataceae bacterium]